MRNASPKGLSPFACLSITIIIVSAHCCGANQSVRNTPVRSLYRRVHIDTCAAPAEMRVVANPLIVHLNVRIRKLVWHQGSSRSTFSNTIGSMQVQKSLLSGLPKFPEEHHKAGSHFLWAHRVAGAGAGLTLAAQVRHQCRVAEQDEDHADSKHQAKLTVSEMCDTVKPICTAYATSSSPLSQPAGTKQK